MDFEQILTLPNAVFCLMVWVLVWLQRKGVSFAWKSAEKNRLWREVLLPAGPLVTGGVLAAVVSDYPMPEQFADGSARVIFGVVLGLFSAHVYKMAKPYMSDMMQKVKPAPKAVAAPKAAPKKKSAVRPGARPKKKAK